MTQLSEILEIANNYIYCGENSRVEQYLTMLDDTHVGIDLETSGFDPHGTVVSANYVKPPFIRLISIEANDCCVLFDLFKLNKKSIQLISEYLTDPNRILVIMNAKFDIKWMLNLLPIEKFNRMYCTMLASQILSCGKVKFGHSLQNIVSNLFDYELEKDQGGSNWGIEHLSDSQLKYAALDACFLRPIREIQVEDLRRLQLVEVAEIEFRAIEPYARMELDGIKLHKDRWLRNANRNKLRAIRMETKVSKALQPDDMPVMLFDDIPSFKVSSTKQLTTAMEAAGIKIPMMYKKGVEKETIQVDYLEKIKDTHPAIPQIIKYSGLKKSHTSYGQNWVDKIHPVTQRIHPDIFQIGTETGRNAFREPNLQQIPVENIFRNCFIPEPGKKFLGGDYNACELRILAQASQDRAMIKAYNEGYDLHTYTASVVFSIPYEQMVKVLKDKKLKDYTQYKIYRTRAKNLNFGIVYGIGAKRFAANADITVEEAYRIIDDYFALYEGVKNWIEWAQNQARFKGISRTMSGRAIKHYIKDQEDWREVGTVQRLGSNFPIQGTNADITKIAMRNLYDEFGKKVKFVNCIHDEILLECEAKSAKKYLPVFIECMQKAGEVYIKDVPVVVEAEILDRWGK